MEFNVAAGSFHPFATIKKQKTKKQQQKNNNIDLNSLRDVGLLQHEPISVVVSLKY